MARRSSSKNGPEMDHPPPYAEQRYFSAPSSSIEAVTSMDKLGTDLFLMTASGDVGSMPPASPRTVNKALNGRSREELEEMLLVP